MGLPIAQRDERIRRARAEVFDAQRSQLGSIGAFADLTVAVGVPLALWDHVPHGVLLTWTALVTAFSYGWEVLATVFPAQVRDNEVLRDRWGWGSSLVWAGLPWLAFDSLDEPGVVWVLAVVVIFAIATDLVFLTQTEAISLDAMMLTYVTSYLVAFAAAGSPVAAGAVGITGVSLYAGCSGWSGIADQLIHQRVESEERALVDDLTGLGSREAAVEVIDSLRRSGAERIRCAFLDIDDFKQLNDNYGYEVGDLVLRSVGEILANGLPPGWSVARFGGDEFVAVGVDEVDLESLIDVTVMLPEHGGLQLAQPLSVGVTSLPIAEADADRLFREAATALRVAKRLGKHKLVEMTDQLREAESNRSLLGSRAASALEDREIVPFAQPIVDLKTSRPVGLELLARWPQSDGTMVMPDQFIPVIEDQGRGPALGLLMIEHATVALAGPAIRDSQIFVTVNLSARHLFHRRLPTEVLRLLERHDVAASRLVLEITESQHLPSSPVWRETAARLRDLGVGLAIDDFGTGYSSMEQLLSMPFSHLKVDRVLTQAFERPGALDLAAAIAAMANGDGLVTVAEGIETEAERVAMRDAGYRYGQGYLFARPAPLADVLATVADHDGAEVRS